MSVIFSDLHLREQSEEMCFKVLDAIEHLTIKNGSHVIFCGDWWHLRYQVKVRLLNRVGALIARWGALGIEMDLIPGNHDQVDVAGSNALEVFEAQDHVHTWTRPGVRKDPRGLSLGFVPYRKDPAEQADALAAIDSEKPDLIFGHFGVQDALMNGGRPDKDGIQIQKLSAPLILGHYHKAQEGPGWRYIGSPYQTSYGEAGNVCGCLTLSNGIFSFVPIEVGAPTHYILEWDLSEDDQPPINPGDSHDRVRLDIKAPQNLLSKVGVQKALKDRGLSDAQINVVPVTGEREIKMTLKRGETLFSAADRFLRERLDPHKDGIPCAAIDSIVALGALKRWAGTE